MVAKGKANEAGSTNDLRGDVLRVFGVLKVATADQIQRLSSPHLTYRHTLKKTAAQRKEARTASPAGGAANDLRRQGGRRCARVRALPATATRSGSASAARTHTSWCGSSSRRAAGSACCADDADSSCRWLHCRAGLLGLVRVLVQACAGWGRELYCHSLNQRVWCSMATATPTSAAESPEVGHASAAADRECRAGVQRVTCRC